MTREQVEDWIRRYERAWRTPGTDTLRELFTDEATYLQSPYRRLDAWVTVLSRYNKRLDFRRPWRPSSLELVATSPGSAS
jgi:hypothetical protein